MVPIVAGLVYVTLPALGLLSALMIWLIGA